VVPASQGGLGYPYFGGVALAVQARLTRVSAFR